MTTNIKAFYHIAAMNHWLDIVNEQKDICDCLNIKPICGFLGDYDQKKIAENLGLKIKFHSKNFKKYEIPTLKMLYHWSQNNLNSYVIYFHTKGASSDENDVFKTKWRHIMNDFVIKNYESNIKELEKNNADVIGVNWTECGNFKHFSGNFWIAKTNYINTLKNPLDYQMHGGIYGKSRIGLEPWERMSAEMWIGDNANVKTLSLFYKGGPFSPDDKIIWNYEQQIDNNYIRIRFNRNSLQHKNKPYLVKVFSYNNSEPNELRLDHDEIKNLYSILKQYRYL